MREALYRLSIVVAVASAILFSPVADAAWMMIEKEACDASEIQCPQGFEAECVDGEATEMTVCAPVIVEEKKPAGENEDPKKKPHEGPYEGNPIGGPNFN